MVSLSIAKRLKYFNCITFHGAEIYALSTSITNISKTLLILMNQPNTPEMKHFSSIFK